jgi:protein NrfC
MAGEKTPAVEESEKKKFSRRDFVVGSGTALAGGALAVVTAGAAEPPAKKKASDYPLSKKYLVYDSRHCEGCMSCMFACSMVHEGVSSLSLSRIQVSRAVLTKYPLDIQINVCRQCPEPMCVENCPTGACHVSAENGNVRMIDSEKCIGCGECLQSCPHTPHRTIWNSSAKKSTKCDLCVHTPYFQKKGGPFESQACVSTCPAGALKLVAELPSQADESGYDFNFAPPPPRGTVTSAAKPDPAAPAKKE